MGMDLEHRVFFSGLDWVEGITKTASMSLNAVTRSDMYGDYNPNSVWGVITLNIGPEGDMQLEEGQFEEDFEIIVDLTLPQAIAIKAALGSLIAYLQYDAMIEMPILAQRAIDAERTGSSPASRDAGTETRPAKAHRARRARLS
jgi:hypothetical protein